MPATATRKPAPVLKTELAADGKLKHSLPAKEAAKLAKALDLCSCLGNVATLHDQAAAAFDALGKLMETLGVDPAEFNV